MMKYEEEKKAHHKNAQKGENHQRFIMTSYLLRDNSKVSYIVLLLGEFTDLQAVGLRAVL